LSALISDAVPNCSHLDILVGYFFMDGLELIRSAIENNPHLTLRILVGMDSGCDTKDLVRYAQKLEWQNKGPVPETYRKKLRDIGVHESSLNDTSIWAEMIRGGRLQIRQTNQKNHSKLYLFRQNPEADSFVVVGSSNLSSQGLQERQEMNVEVRKADLGPVQALFEQEWANAVPVSHFSDNNPDALPRKSIGGPLPAFDAYLKILREFLKRSSVPREKDDLVRNVIDKAGLDVLEYQVDAVLSGLGILDQYDGVLIADVVGLGKTIVACALAAASNQKTGIVLCPPHIVEKWDETLEDFSLGAGWKAISMYNDGDINARLEATPPSMVIVDEAHRIRNNTLESYSKIFNICRSHGRKVVLLTATPFNNRPRDIEALLDLIPKLHFETGHYELRRIFKELDDQYADIRLRMRKRDGTPESLRKELVKMSVEIKEHLRRYIVRRNRIDLKNSDRYWPEVEARMARQEPPEMQLFDLDDGQDRFYDQILSEYFGGPEPRFSGTLYRPAKYLKKSENDHPAATPLTFDEQSQDNQYRLTCRFLVQRFESSFAAFKKSVESLLAVSETALSRFEQEGVFSIDRKEIKDWLKRPNADVTTDESHDDPDPDFDEFDDNLVPGSTERTTFVRSDFDRPEEFAANIGKDNSILREILQTVDSLDLVKNDPKASALVATIRNVLNDRPLDGNGQPAPLRKVVVFSMFADTVEHLNRKLEAAFGAEKVVMMTGKLKTKTNLKSVERDFRVGKEGAKYGTIRDDGASVLVTTDALAEGIDLNRAGLVVNYDIPWNPTRVIQRVGRVNRIVRKVFDSIFVYNFFPTEKGERVLGTRLIARTKLEMIHSIVAEDAQLLDVSEIPRAAGSTDVLSILGEAAIHDVEKAQQNEVSCVNDRLKECEKEFHEFYGGTISWDQKLQEIDDLPGSGIQTVIQNEGSAPKELVVFEFIRNGWSCLHVDDSDVTGTHRPIGLVAALDKIRCSPWTRTAPFDTRWKDALDGTNDIVSEYDYGHKMARIRESDPRTKATDVLRRFEKILTLDHLAQTTDLKKVVRNLNVSKWELKVLGALTSSDALVEFLRARGQVKISLTENREEERDRQIVAAIGVVAHHC